MLGDEPHRHKHVTYYEYAFDGAKIEAIYLIEGDDKYLREALNSEPYKRKMAVQLDCRFEEKFPDLLVYSVPEHGFLRDATLVGKLTSSGVYRFKISDQSGTLHFFSPALGKSFNAHLGMSHTIE